MSEPGAAPLHVLVGVNGSSGPVLRQAGDLARRLGARLDIVHVVDLRDLATVVPAGLGAIPPTGSLPEQRAAIDDRRQNLMQEAERELREFQVEWECHTREGDPGTALSELAEELDAYCVVVGTRGEGFATFLERLVHPSVSRALIRGAHRPVLVVPETETE